MKEIKIALIKVEEADTYKDGIITPSTIIPGKYQIKLTSESDICVRFEITNDFHYIGTIYQRPREWFDKVQKQAVKAGEAE